MRKFLSGNEAFAEGVRLARPQVISAYPITPQTTVVEALASMVEDGSLACEYLHVESEHTALSAAIGASATGARTFTGHLVPGAAVYGRVPHLRLGRPVPHRDDEREPRASPLPWNIYGDQRDSLVAARVMAGSRCTPRTTRRRYDTGAAWPMPMAEDPRGDACR